MNYQDRKAKEQWLDDQYESPGQQHSDQLSQPNFLLEESSPHPLRHKNKVPKSERKIYGHHQPSGMPKESTTSNTGRLPIQTQGIEPLHIGEGPPLRINNLFGEATQDRISPNEDTKTQNEGRFHDEQRRATARFQTQKAGENRDDIGYINQSDNDHGPSQNAIADTSNNQSYKIPASQTPNYPTEESKQEIELDHRALLGQNQGQSHGQKVQISNLNQAVGQHNFASLDPNFQDSPRINFQQQPHPNGNDSVINIGGSAALSPKGGVTQASSRVQRMGSGSGSGQAPTHLNNSQSSRSQAINMTNQQNHVAVMPNAHNRRGPKLTTIDFNSEAEDLAFDNMPRSPGINQIPPNQDNYDLESPRLSNVDTARGLLLETEPSYNQGPAQIEQKRSPQDLSVEKRSMPPSTVPETLVPTSEIPEVKKQDHQSNDDNLFETDRQKGVQEEDRFTEDDILKVFSKAKSQCDRRLLWNRYVSAHTKIGQLVDERDMLMLPKSSEVREDQYPSTKLDDSDLKGRIEYQQLKQRKVESLCEWKQKDLKGLKKAAYIKQVIQKNERILSAEDKNALESLEAYTDKWPLLQFRKSVLKIKILINMVAHAIIKNPMFENVSIAVILVNSFVMMIEDPSDTDPSPFFKEIDNVFLILYSVEMFLKIFGLGLLFSKNAYLKDSWNILDFVIVLSGYLTLITEDSQASSGGAQGGEAFNLSGLRVFRVMRPLKTVSSIKGLRVLMQALLQAIPLLRDTVIILAFFALIFSIAGTQLLAGNLKHRCFAVQTGRYLDSDQLCGAGGASECPGGYICGRSNANPNFGVTNFDNIMYSVLVVFQSITLEGWSDIQRQMQRAYTYLIFIYFLPLVFIGAFFLLNLTLAVINSKFTQVHHEHQLKEQQALAGMPSNKNIDSELANALTMKDEWSISQFFAARKYAKLMIAFLRRRQREKKEELEKLMAMDPESQQKYKQTAKASALRGGKSGAPARGKGEKLAKDPEKKGIKREGMQREFTGNDQDTLKDDFESSEQKDMSSSSPQAPFSKSLHPQQSVSNPMSQTPNPRQDKKFRNTTAGDVRDLDRFGALDGSELDKEEAQIVKHVQNFLKNTREQMKKEGKLTKDFDIQIPKTKGKQFMARRKRGQSENKQLGTVTPNHNSQFPLRQNRSLKIKANLGNQRNIMLTKRFKEEDNMGQNPSELNQGYVDIDVTQLDLDYLIPSNLQKHDKTQIQQAGTKTAQEQFEKISIQDIAGDHNDDQEFLDTERGLIDRSRPQTALTEETQHNQNKKNIEKPQDQKPNGKADQNTPTTTSNNKDSKQDKKQKPRYSVSLEVSSDSDFDPGNKDAGHATPLNTGNTKSPISQPTGSAATQASNSGNMIYSTLTYNDKNIWRQFRKIIAQANSIDARVKQRKLRGASEIYTNGWRANEIINERLEDKFSRSKWKMKKVFAPTCLNELQNEVKPPVALRRNLKQDGERNKELTALAEERVSCKKPIDPFQGLDHKTKKVEITKGLPYLSTSANDVLQLRQLDQGKAKLAQSNRYVRLPREYLKYMDPDYEEAPFIEKQYDPHQHKIVYQVDQDSSELEDGEASDNEDQLCHLEQPFQTITRHGYYEQLKQAPLIALAHRSDIMITSTISVSLFPIDNRKISTIVRTDMGKQQLQEYLDEKNAFRAMTKAHYYECPMVPDKAKAYRDNYIQSFVYKSTFRARALENFKESVQRANSTKKEEKPIDPEKRRAEVLKHQQNMRASRKREIPLIDMKSSRLLLEGKYHEQEDEVDEQNRQADKKAKEKDELRDEILKQEQNELKHLLRLREFEQQLIQIVREDQKAKVPDPIPLYLREEFSVPEEMDNYEINYPEVRRRDFSVKKFRPKWSGQDVLRDQLDHKKSEGVVEHINFIRVWPPGFRGLLKRVRYVLRAFVRMPLFDSFMTFAVLLNTIVLSIDHHGIGPEVGGLLVVFNEWFTYIFIFEMSVKLLALGIQKYCADRMNWLDGAVVLISVFELIYTAAQAGEGEMNLKAFATVRMFRTFRVFRIARLLRALESMQTILGVIERSYKSFVYITLLMFVFIFIYSLLGMQVFGGKFNYPDGKPRGNYDGFTIAAVTVFQVLTMENWQSVLFDSMRGDINKLIISVYYISWIFLGNFILLNLFLAILLDSFLEEEDEADDNPEELQQRRRNKIARANQRKKRKQRKILLMGNQKLPEPSKFYFGEVKGESEEDLEDLDEEQITKIFKEQGMMRKEKEEIRAQQLYLGVECESSFYIFSKQNWLRIQCYKIIKTKCWDQLVMLLIFLSSIKLAFDTFFIYKDKDSLLMVVSTQYVDICFNISFIIEMVVKHIAIGFVMDEGSYLRESWNQLDFFIVVSSIADMALSGYALPAMKILRLLRTLRPLRVISHNVSLKMIVIALLGSVGGIFNVMVVVFVVWLIFAIMGVNFYGGRFFYCNIEPFELHTERECQFVGGQWMRYDHHFDSVVGAMSTLFVVSSLEGWPDIMLQAVDSTDVEKGPQEESSIGQALYFVLFILVGSFFFLNFFIGVLFLKYNQAQKLEILGFTTQDLGWMDIQRLILTSSPDYETTNVPQQAWRKKFHDIVTNGKFDLVIMACIVANMLQMGCHYETITEELAAIVDFSNLIFTAVFIIEATFKLVAFGTSYFSNAWNKFDFFVVVSSIFDILLKQVGSSFEFLSVGPQLARVMRVLRVTRIVRLAGKAEGLQAIISTIVFSVPSLMNVFMLLMLIFFMFSILGVFMFGDVKQGEVIDDLKNFNDFFNSFLLLFAVSTGEDWNKIMYDCSRQPPECIPQLTCGSSLSFLYFYLLILICSHVMLNLFILVIIQQFEKYYLPQDNAIKRFKSDLDDFMKVWKIFTQDKYRCQKIKEKQLTRFFRKLGETGDKDTSLGFPEHCYEDGELKKNLLRMGIKSDNGFIYFNELLYRCMRRKYGSFKVNKKMQIFELRTQFQIYTKTLKQQKTVKTRLGNADIFASIVQKGSGVNPFLTMMNFSISYKTWLKFARQRMQDAALKSLKGQTSSVSEILARLASQVRPKVYDVEIEQELVHSETDEEDCPDRSQSPVIIKKQKTMAKMTAGGKVLNHLELFERRMSASMNRSGSPGGKLMVRLRTEKAKSGTRFN